MKCALNLIADYVLESDLIAVPNHFNMHNLKNNLLKLMIFETTFFDKCNIARFEWLILFLNLSPLKLLNKVWFETDLSKGARPSLLSSLLKKVLLNLDFFKLMRKNLLMENVHGRILKLGQWDLTLRRFLIRVDVLLALSCN